MTNEVKRVISEICDKELTDRYYTLKSKVEKWSEEYGELTRDRGTSKGRIEYAKMEFETTFAQLQECVYIIGLLREHCK